MPVGASGRIVIEVDPELKQELYSLLDEDGLNLKQWFLENVSDYLSHRRQPELPFFSQGVDTKDVNS